MRSRLWREVRAMHPSWPAARIDEVVERIIRRARARWQSLYDLDDWRFVSAHYKDALDEAIYQDVLKEAK